MTVVTRIGLALTLLATSMLAQAAKEPVVLAKPSYAFLVGRWTAENGMPGQVIFSPGRRVTLAPTGTIPLKGHYLITDGWLEIKADVVTAGKATMRLIVRSPTEIQLQYAQGGSQTFKKQAAK